MGQKGFQIRAHTKAHDLDLRQNHPCQSQVDGPMSGATIRTRHSSAWNDHSCKLKQTVHTGKRVICTTSAGSGWVMEAPQMNDRYPPPPSPPTITSTKVGPRVHPLLAIRPTQTLRSGRRCVPRCASRTREYYPQDPSTDTMRTLGFHPENC